MSRFFLFNLFLALFIAESFVFGFVSDLQKLIKAESNRFFEKNNFLSYSASNANSDELKKQKSISIEQDFLLSTLLRIKPHHEKFIATEKRCSFYSYLLSGLAQNSLGAVKNIAINTQDKPLLVDLLSFYKNIVKNECPQVRPVAFLGTTTKYKATLDNIASMIPQSSSNCSEDYKKILHHDQIFNLCSIYENSSLKNTQSFFLKFRQGFPQRLRKSLSKSQRFFLDNLCLTQKSPERFCKDIFEADHWQKIARGESSPHKAAVFCGTNDKTTRKCLNKISKEPQSCYFPDFLNSSLLPAQDCRKLSLSFNHSRLNTKYPECPYSLDNLGLVASARLISHLKKLNYPLQAKSCLAYPLSIFLDFNLELGNDLAWTYQLCYTDRINDKEVCATSLMGTLEKSEYSQDKIITRILRKTGDIGRSQECKAIDKDRYQPSLLKYQSGCFIIYNSFQCRLRKCSFKIVNNGKALNDVITVKGVNDFDFIAHSRDYRKLAQSQLIPQQLKKRTLQIRNLSVLKNFLKNHPKDITHGTGCAENLLPQFFRARSLNQCTPLPFIVDAVVPNKEETLLVVRTALDHLHAPRLIPWHRVFSSVKLLHDIHPQKLWSFHGVY